MVLRGVGSLLCPVSFIPVLRSAVGTLAAAAGLGGSEDVSVPQTPTRADDIRFSDLYPDEVTRATGGRVVLNLVPRDANGFASEPLYELDWDEMEMVIIYHGMDASAQVDKPNRIGLETATNMRIQYRLAGILHQLSPT